MNIIPTKSTDKLQAEREQVVALIDDIGGDPGPYDERRKDWLKAIERRDELAREIRAAEERELQHLSVADRITVLEGRRDGYEAERAELMDGMPALQARYALDAREHGKAYTRALQRVAELGYATADTGRTLAALRSEHAAARARAWLATATRLYEAAIVAEAHQLEAIAALANAYEQAIRDGASAQALPTLPQASVARLRELKAHVAGLITRGIKIDIGKLPAAVRDYVSG